MLTLADINQITGSHDGDIYSDLYKDVYGSRPRGATFESVADFDKDMEFLSKQLERELEREREEQAQATLEFEQRVMDTMDLVVGADRDRAIQIIANAEGIDQEELIFYGWESLEWKLGLKFGYIKQTLQMFEIPG